MYPTRARCHLDNSTLSFERKFEFSLDSIPGTLPPSAENLSSAAQDILKRLLQPNPRMRLRSLLDLQRIAFYMGHDLNSYIDKKISPFQFLDKKLATASSIIV